MKKLLIILVAIGLYAQKVELELVWERGFPEGIAEVGSLTYENGVPKMIIGNDGQKAVSLSQEGKILKKFEKDILQVENDKYYIKFSSNGEYIGIWEQMKYKGKEDLLAKITIRNSKFQKVFETTVEGVLKEVSPTGNGFIIENEKGKVLITDFGNVKIEFYGGFSTSLMKEEKIQLASYPFTEIINSRFKIYYWSSHKKYPFRVEDILRKLPSLYFSFDGGKIIVSEKDTTFILDIKNKNILKKLGHPGLLLRYTVLGKQFLLGARSVKGKRKIHQYIVLINLFSQRKEWLKDLSYPIKSKNGAKEMNFRIKEIKLNENMKICLISSFKGIKILDLKEGTLLHSISFNDEKLLKVFLKQENLVIVTSKKIYFYRVKRRI